MGLNTALGKTQFHLISTLVGTYQVCYINAMDRVFHALSDESRRTMLSRLREGPATVTQLAGMLDIARPGVSRHLRVLREAGLVEAQADAQFRIYALRAEPLADVDRWLDDYRAIWTQRFDALHTEVARGKRERGDEDE